MEPDSRTDRDIRDALSGRNADSQRATNRTNHGTTRKVWQDRREECVLLVPKPQSTGEAEAEAQQYSRSQQLS